MFNSSGFTLIEFVIVIAIIAGIALAIGFLGLDIYESQITFSNAIEIQQEIQQTLAIMLPELRSLEPSANGSYPIVLAVPGSVEFYSDQGSDGSIDKIRYFVDGEVLKKGTVRPSGDPPVYDPGSENINEVVQKLANASVFSFYGKNYTEASLPLSEPVNIADIKMIEITITVNPGLTGASSSLEFSSRVTPRNLR